MPDERETFNATLARGARRGTVAGKSPIRTCHFIEYLDVAAPVLAEPRRPVDGMIQAPARPGIGLQWNEDAVTRYRMS